VTADVETSTLRARQLINLTEALTERLAVERDAFRAHRAQDVAASMAETQELANLYRRESAQAKAAPAFLTVIPAELRDALIAATQDFEAVLAEHASTVDAARQVSEGLVRTIAAEVAGARAQGAGYGASGRATEGDGRAVALNRKA
jgi:hypothetical protein